MISYLFLVLIIFNLFYFAFILWVVPCLDFSIFSQITSSLSFYFLSCSLNKDVHHIGFLLLPKSFVQGFSLGHLPPKCNHPSIGFLFVKSFSSNLSWCLWVSMFFFFPLSLWISAFITRKLKRYALYPFNYSHNFWNFSFMAISDNKLCLS